MNLFFKKIFVFSAVVVLLSGCSEKGDICTDFPATNTNATMPGNEGISYSDTTIMVDFYLDSLENTACIKYEGVSKKFLSDVVDAKNSFDSRDFYMAKSESSESYVIKEKKDKIFNPDDDSLYVNNSTPESKKSNGIMKKVFIDDDSPIDTENVTVIFTDLSEPDIKNTAIKIREKYLSSGNFSYCMINCPVPIDEKYNNPIYLSTGESSVKQFKIPELKKEDECPSERYYTLFIFGQPAKISRYLNKLESLIEDEYKPQDGDEYNRCKYYTTKYQFHNHIFTSDDLEYKNPKDTNSENPYTETNVRLVEPEKTRIPAELRSQVLEFAYDKDAVNQKSVSFFSRGYKNSEFSALTYDFALNLNLKFSEKNYDIKFVNMEEDVNGKKTPILENSDFYQNAYYTIGDVECYVQNKKKTSWELFDEEEQKFFFKEAKTDKGHINIISNGAYAKSVGDVYLSIPIYEIVPINNYVPEWVLEREKSGNAKEFVTTRNLKLFYCNLNGINTENRKGEILSGDEEKYSLGRAGTVNILISGL